MSISAVMLHHFHDEKRHIKAQGSIDEGTFDRLLDWLKADYRILHPHEYSEKLLAGTLSPQEICLTFDDALKCQVDIAVPVLKEHGLSAFFFVYSNAFHGPPDHLEVFRDFRHRCFQDVEGFYDCFFTILDCERPDLFADYLKRYPADYLSAYPFYTELDRRFRFVRDNVLTREEYDAMMFSMIESRNYCIEEHSAHLFMTRADLKLLAAEGHVVGLHSNSHPTTIDKFTYQDQLSEYRRNKAFLEECLGSEIWAMSHPCGRYNDDTLRVLRGLGIRIGFRSALSDRVASPLEIPREDHTNLLKKLPQAA